MAQASGRIDVYIESGKKRVFAGAVEWPGWCRSGRDEASALAALLDYADRYAAVLKRAAMDLEAPASVQSFHVLERLEGSTTTDFGAPAMAPSGDAKPAKAKDLQRFERLLKACWQEFDAARRKAQGKELRKGPRGGGRELEAIVQHVIGADQAYLGAIGWKLKLDEKQGTERQLEQARKAVLEGLAAASAGELPSRGPRGGTHWSPRYFVRRVAWHVLDHAWEIEDRIVEAQ